MTGRGRAGNPSRSPAIACLLLSAACGDPPVPLPTSGSLPADDVHLGMTFRELLEARPGAMLFPDTGVVEELWRGRYHYGFTANPPRHRSRLVYVDRVRDEMQGDYARREWDRLVRSLAAELDLQPHCAAIEYARLRWRRAMLRGDGRRVAAAVEVQAVTTGDPGPGLAQLITSVWLAQYATPVSRFPEVPEWAGDRMPRWEACAEDEA